MNHIAERARASNIQKRIQFFPPNIRASTPNSIATARNAEKHTNGRGSNAPTTPPHPNTNHAQSPKDSNLPRAKPLKNTERKGGAKARYPEIRASIKNSEPIRTRERRRKSGITVGFKDTVGGGGGGGGHAGRSC